VASLNQKSGDLSIDLESRPVPVPKPGEVLVRVHASSLNYHDRSVAKGILPTESGRILMSDGAGEVVELGDGVDGIEIGNRVVSTYFPNWISGLPTLRNRYGISGEHVDGFAAEYVAKPAECFLPMPKQFSYRQASTLPCAAVTAWNGLFSNRPLKQGDWVLIQGTGGVSLFALQFAKMIGARVIATSSSEEKLQKLLELGADHVLNYRTDPKWGRKAYKLSGVPGVAKVIDVGGANTLGQSINACALGGDIAMIGVLTGRSSELSTLKVMEKNLTITGISVGHRQHQIDMMAAIELNGLEPVLDRDFPLENISSAFAYQSSQRHFGKITLSLS